MTKFKNEEEFVKEVSTLTRAQKTLVTKVLDTAREVALLDIYAQDANKNSEFIIPGYGKVLYIESTDEFAFVPNEKFRQATKLAVSGNTRILLDKLNEVVRR